MPTITSLVLASASPRRSELLRSLGLEVTVRPSAYGEPDDPRATPLELAIRHARAKALDVRAADPASERLIVAADTVVDLDGEALGKPRDRAEARTMIGRLAGRSHIVHTAFALRDTRSGAELECVESTTVRFAVLDDVVLDAYAASGDGLDKAGAYGIQGFAATLVERIDGDYFTVVGFPLARFAQALPELGYRLLPRSAGVPA
jgi:septum formation protein